MLISIIYKMGFSNHYWFLIEQPAHFENNFLFLVGELSVMLILIGNGISDLHVKLFAFHYMLMPFGKTWICLFYLIYK